MYRQSKILLALLGCQNLAVLAFVQPSSPPFKRESVKRRLSEAVSGGEPAAVKARHALLISSYSDGVLKSTEAQSFLRDALLTSMHSKETVRIENKLKESVVASPCNGPDPAALEAMERIDEASGDLILEQLEEPVVRFVYIPTAMYALRADSTRSPGKQRQRARADGQKRRTQIVNHLTSLLGEKVSIQALTLDLDDGSVKQPEGFDSSEYVPLKGEEALDDWNPHLVYVEGGNTFWLYHCMEKGNWKQSILDAVTGDDAAVYCGKSAGAIIAGAQMETATWKEWDDPSVVPGKESYEDWTGVSGLDLIDGSSIFPHMDDRWTAMVAERSGLIPTPVCILSDSEVCLFDGTAQKVSVVSSNEFS